jgi:hypothetical protein
MVWAIKIALKILTAFIKDEQTLFNNKNSRFSPLPQPPLLPPLPLPQIPLQIPTDAQISSGQGQQEVLILLLLPEVLVPGSQVGGVSLSQPH